MRNLTCNPSKAMVTLPIPICNVRPCPDFEDPFPDQRNVIDVGSVRSAPAMLKVIMRTCTLSGCLPSGSTSFSDRVSVEIAVRRPRYVARSDDHKLSRDGRADKGSHWDASPGCGGQALSKRLSLTVMTRC